VPLGKTKKLIGYIVAIHDALDDAAGIEEKQLKSIEDLLDADPLISPEVMETTRWVSDYYAAPWGEVLKAALPAGINETFERVISITAAGRQELETLPAGKRGTLKGRVLDLASKHTEISANNIQEGADSPKLTTTLRQLQEKGLITVHLRTIAALVKPKRRKFVRLIQNPDAAEQSGKMTSAQYSVIDALSAGGGEMAFSELVEVSDAGASSIQTLAKRGLVEIFVSEVRRDPLGGQDLGKALSLELTAAQSEALVKIESALRSRRYQAFLLHGVTGSGKTEVYIRAMRATLAEGRSAMMLVPEIALTPVFSRRLRTSFGDQVAIFHSSLSPGERFDEWTRLKRGEARVVIGTRSAVFAPISDLGLVVIDEEHDASYRQQEAPFYNGRDTAIIRALKESAAVILGSATPSLESVHNAKRGKYEYLRLPSRINDRAMARAELIDMRPMAGSSGRSEIFAPVLLEAIEETHARGEQSIILLNRRGYSSFVLCRSCGESIQCVNCDVTLTYHREESAMICHYCNFRRAAPSKCPSCGGVYIYFVGEGTEQLEESLKKRFTHLRIARVDRDTVSRHKSFERMLLSFSAGEIDMLVGTQMLAKGHDFHNVTLVGVVSVDAGLALPDFRSAERTFQLITQVAGRAGRGVLEGKVLIQTYHPQHYALRYACEQDYDGFYEEEIKHRRNLNYPPFVALAALLIHDGSFTTAQAQAAEIRRALDSANRERACRILGPAPAPLARLRGEHRIQILVKSTGRPQMRELIDVALAEAGANGVNLRNVNVEIDPINLM
jgi:primosomal protein N' (replication factor Y)